MEFVQSSPGEDPIVVEAFIPVEPSKVFRAWTDPEIVMKWFGLKPCSLQSAAIDLRPGGMWRFEKSRHLNKSAGFEGEYIEIEFNRRLVFTWSQYAERATGDRDVERPSRVEILFMPQGNGTRIRVTHSEIQTKESRIGFSGGWEAGFRNLSRLLAAHQNGLENS